MAPKKAIGKKSWNVGDVLQKGVLKIVIHKIEEDNIVYLFGWQVLHTKNVFPDDVKLQKGWKKIDVVEPYNQNVIRKTKHFNAVKGII